MRGASYPLIFDYGKNGKIRKGCVLSFVILLVLATASFTERVNLMCSSIFFFFLIERIELYSSSAAGLSNLFHYS